jgi:hypothetical protein
MSARRFLGALVLALLLVEAHFLYGQQRRWQQYEREMQDPVDDPPDAWAKTEFAFGRLRYRGGGYGYGFRGRGGGSRWGIDANKSDRLFIQIVRRLTRVDARSVEQIVDVDDDDMFNWPFLYAVHPDGWVFSESQAARLREFFARGGFLMVDDFHNEYGWARFMEGINQVLPNHQVVELQNDNPIFHVVYDMSNRPHIPGLNVVGSSFPWENGGVGEHWRAVVDDKGRVQVAACFNMDMGDAWEWADYPYYPEKLASAAMRIGIDYVLYSMTH